VSAYAKGEIFAMRKICKKLLTLLVTASLVLSTMSFYAHGASSSFYLPDDSLADVQTAISTALPGDEIIVDGWADDFTSTLALNIPQGVTVRWNAGLFSMMNAYLFDISGTGTFEVSGYIASYGSRSSGAINATGPVTINVVDYAMIMAENTGNAILISSDNVTVNINGGMVSSQPGNSNAAIQVGSGSNNNIMGTVINVNDGSVISDVGGYAINDGAGAKSVTNDTKITVNGGLVLAASASAIHSTGVASTVTVNGGLVVNTAASNANPTIYINADPASQGHQSVTITGGTVQNMATNATSYSIQTTGNITVSGGAVYTTNGRGINLVGINSRAVISGGSVEALGSGTAICTATTAGVNVNNTSIEVSGGKVSSLSGHAIRITGVNTAVTVSGGAVSASGASDSSAIQVDSSASNATITISGGSVDATAAGNAIYVVGTANVSVNVRGGRVTAKTGQAIRTAGIVTLSGGFVFAYRAHAAQVINANNISLSPGSEALVVSWNAEGLLYERGELPSAYPGNKDLDVALGGDITMVAWDNLPFAGSGIRYAFGSNTGFFPIYTVLVVGEFGLIFDVGLEKLLKVGYTMVETEFTDFPQAWSISGNTLTLHGFSWATSYPVALTVRNGDGVIYLDGSSLFESVYPGGIGIDSSDSSLTVAGNGTLTAKGADTPYGVGLDIGDNQLTVEFSATLIAQGGLRAIDWAGAVSPNSDDVVVSPAGTYYRWKWSKNYDGSGTVMGDSPTGDWNEGFKPPTSFEFYSDDRFVMLRALESVSLLDVVQIGGAEDVSDSTALILTFSAPVTDLSAADITLTGAAYISAESVVSGGETVWTITLGGVTAQDLVAVSVAHFGDYFVENNMQSTQVYKAIIPSFMLSVSAEPAGGGSVSMGSSFADGPQFQEFLPGTHIEVTAFESAGFVFTGWTVDGVVLEGRLADALASFDMPSNNVSLIANFAPIPAPGNGGGNGGNGGGTAGPPAQGGVNDGPGGGLGENNESISQEEGHNVVAHILNTVDHIQYIQGVGNNLFEPERSITRAEVAQIFYNLLLDRNVPVTARFPDVASGAWYEAAVNALAFLRVIIGQPDGNFHPDAPITRAEFVTVAVRFALEVPDGLAELSFTDVSYEHWAYGNIRAAVHFGWVMGYADGSFRPDRPLSRAETVAIVNRMLERTADREFIIQHYPELSAFYDVSNTHWAFYEIMEAFIGHAYRTENGAEEWE